MEEEFSISRSAGDGQCWGIVVALDQVDCSDFRNGRSLISPGVRMMMITHSALVLAPRCDAPGKEIYIVFLFFAI